MASSRPNPQRISDDLPAPNTLRQLVVRGQEAKYVFPAQVTWPQALEAADGLRAELAADDDLLVIVSPGFHSQPAPSLTVRRLIGVDDALRLRDRLEALVAEYRALAHRLAALFRLHIEPADEGDELYQNPLQVNGETWWWHDHGEHCLFADLDSDIEIEVNTYCPDAIDPYFLLHYAKSTDRYGDIDTACLEGIHDIARMLELATIPLTPPHPHVAG
ncbi:hypothetical protein ACIBEK_35825 [Nocardia fusca]|uniref:hypothetical protein n=1 Tax=Nocardia fusca TaxID=941183 RepID=UPI0037B413B1